MTTFDKAYQDYVDSGRAGKEPTQKDFIRESELIKQNALKHFFNSNNVEKARKAFERALASKEGRIFNYALYKLAWCDYNVQEYANGITKLKEVIEKSEKADDTKSVQLKGEALGDLARFFSYVDEVETAFDYFKKKGGEDIAIRYTTRLGGLFDEQGKWPLQIKTYKMLTRSIR
jgi:tetratricopeptide (TPR) repeat protein